jgi:hypothetical protein
MNISIKPHKMEGGMITAINVKTDGKDEYLTIAPAQFEGFEEMRKIIQTYYELDVIWQEAKQAEVFAKQRLDLVDYKYQVALRDFKLLVNPQKTEVSIKAPEPSEIKRTDEDVQVILAHPTPKPEPAVEKAEPTPKPERKILPPDVTEPQALILASQKAQTDAEKNQVEFINSHPQEPVKTPEHVVKEVTVPQPEAPLIKKLRESPSLQVSEVRDVLPKRALSVLEDVARGLESAQETMDMTKPLVRQTEKTPVEWCTAIVPEVTKRLEGTEFDINTIKMTVSGLGVPAKQVAKVTDLIIAVWEKEGQCETTEPAPSQFWQSIRGKLGFGTKTRKI